MGVQCTVFGHVYDGTEFEEHRTERPRGEVLICREYQVCRRCGNRTEMYRNERLLIPRDPESEGTQGDESAEVPGPPADTADESRNDEHDGTEDPASAEPRASDASADESLVEDVSAEESVIDNRSTETDPVGNDATDRGAIDAQHRGADPPADTARDQILAEDSPDDDPLTDDGVILPDGAVDPEPTVTGTDRGGTRTEDPTNDTASTPDSTSLFDHDVDAGEVGCQACGRVWDRGVTSLRDGDICPECKQGYIEQQ